MKTVARFEKVSLNQWKSDYLFRQSNWKVEADLEYLKLPQRATKGSAGYDFFAPYDIEIPPHDSIKIPTGIRCKIEEGYVLELYPRSSLGFKYRISLNNTVGIVDSDYYNASNEGHIFVKLYNPTDNLIEIKEGEAFAQGIFKEFFLAKEEEVTVERTGGFGSTNK